MKHIKSKQRDLHRMFNQILTIRELAEPLASFDYDRPATEVRDFMEQRDFDLVGVRVDGVISGIARRENLSGDKLGDHMEPVSEQALRHEAQPILDALEALAGGGFILVSSMGHPAGIATRGDLQKAPLRMWLFGLISLFEMQLLRWVREGFPADMWQTALNQSRIEKAREVFEERRSANDATDLVDCLQLSDKATLIRKIPLFFGLIGEVSDSSDIPTSATKWDRFVRAVTKLRNQVAHSNAIASSAWTDVVRLARQLEGVLAALESTSPRPGR
jgi:hypothetical protein